MIQSFNIPSYGDRNLGQSSIINVNVSAAQAKVTLLNVLGFVTGNYVLYAPSPGDETGEFLKIQSISGEEITNTTNFSLAHQKGEKAYVLFGTQIKLYRAPNVDGTVPEDSTFSLVGSAFNIDPDSTFTKVYDPAGGDGYWYKATYFNPDTSEESDLLESTAIRGGGFGDYCSVEDVRREAGLSENKQVLDTQISRRRDQARDEINSALVATGYILPLVDGNKNPFTPMIISHVNRMLGAGFVMVQDYGPVASVDSKDGEAKIKEARAILQRIQDSDLVLLDTNFNQLARVDRVSGYPDTTLDSTDQSNPTGAKFTMDKKF